MNELTHLIQRMSDGDDQAGRELYEAVYAQLRRMAGRQMLQERPNHTLDPTGLVNEAYLRLVSDGSGLENRRHFFRVASEAMRRILIEKARSKARIKRGGKLERCQLSDSHVCQPPTPDAWIDLDGALRSLEAESPENAELVKLHIFSGLSLRECAETLGTSLSTVERKWRFTKAWLKAKIDGGETHPQVS